MARSCTICGADINAESQPYVTANRRVYHLHHEKGEAIKTEEYEEIISTLKEGLSLQKLSIDKKNEIFLQKQELIDQTLEENSKLIESRDHWEKMTIESNEDAKKLAEESKRYFDELSIYKDEHEKQKAKIEELEKFKEEIAKSTENGTDENDTQEQSPS